MRSLLKTVSQSGDLKKVERVGLEPSLHHWVSNHNLFRVEKIARFWKDDAIRLEKHTGEFLTALYSAKIPLFFSLICDGREVIILLGGGETVGRMLISSFPGISMGHVEDKSLIVEQISKLNLSGFIKGIPSRKPGSEKMEKLLRVASDGRWAYVVQAEPLGVAEIKNTIRDISNEIWEVKTQNLLKGTADEENRLAQHQVEVLESVLQKFKMGEDIGMWRASAHILAQEEAVLEAALSTLKGVLSGEDTSPQTVTIHKGDPEADPYTILNSQDLSVLVQLPQEEMQGYTVVDHVKFDVSVPKRHTGRTISVGEVLDGDTQTGTSFMVEIDDLTKNGLVVGVTGTGKTNTCFHILEQAWKKYGIPFLVIESAKSEYRDLAGLEGFNSLKVFTIGDETVAPFRLNPFEVEKGVRIQTHIDHLRSVFNASFVLYAPMPYVLEQALHEIYQDRGWDLTRNENRRGLSPLAYPTLSDFQDKLDEITERMGWEQKMRMDVSASLRARIQSLRVGGKGLMLDTRASTDIDEILKNPTVIELQQVGDDEQKAFIIGLVMVKVYEHYKLFSAKGEIIGGLKHLTLIEEAHRLLKNISTEKASADIANTKGKAVETICNMLSEMRAYGEGMIIAEQIPSKLAPDAIKSTNLKILHRIVDEEDRQVMAGAMNMDEDQKRYISTLKTGRAAVYAEGEDKPILVRIPYQKGKIKERIADTDLAIRYNHRSPTNSPKCEKCESRRNCLGMSKIKDIASDERFRKEVDKFVISALFGGQTLRESFHSLLINVPMQDKQLGCCVIACGIERSVDSRGKLYFWKYDDMIELQHLLERTVEGLIHNRETTGAVEKFQEVYRRLCYSPGGPFPGCSLCTETCLFRYDAERLMKDEEVSENFGSVFEKGSKWEKLEKAGIYCIVAAERAIHSEDINILKKIALCLAAQISHKKGFKIGDQMELCSKVVKAGEFIER